MTLSIKLNSECCGRFLTEIVPQANFSSTVIHDSVDGEFFPNDTSWKVQRRAIFLEVMVINWVLTLKLFELLISKNTVSLPKFSAFQLCIQTFFFIWTSMNKMYPVLFAQLPKICLMTALLWWHLKICNFIHTILGLTTALKKVPHPSY